MKRTIGILAVSAFVLMTSFAQQRPVNERREVNRVERKAQKKTPKAVSKRYPDLEMVEILSTNTEFTIGEKSQTVSAKRTVRPYSINRYETTYRLWHNVRIWAERNGYVFSNPGQEGNGGRRGALPSRKDSLQPVTNINWYDAIVWCNAFSEMDGMRTIPGHIAFALIPCGANSAAITLTALFKAALDEAYSNVPDTPSTELSEDI